MGGLRIVFQRRLPLSLVIGAARRLELDETGVTVSSLFGTKQYPWRAVGSAYRYAPFSRSFWNDDEIERPFELVGVEPLYDLGPAAPPPAEVGKDPESLESITFDRNPRTTNYKFRLLLGLLKIRGRDPDESWPRQAATIFVAREKYGFGPWIDVPEARLLTKK